MFKLSDNEFTYISETIYDFAGINLTEKKRSLIISRLSKRIIALGLSSFDEYIHYLENNDSQGKEFQTMIDSLTTNYSLFFRENHHFDFLKSQILPQYTRGQELNIWSAAASTGQEIYSILMTLKDYEEQNGVKLHYKLHASDISRSVLQKASSGIYQSKEVDSLDPKVLKKYFLKGTGSSEGSSKIRNELIREVKFFRLNLKDDDFSLPKMDIIFLRNAIIYFDEITRKGMIKRMHRQLKPGGYLIIGHSESLVGNDEFKLIGKTIYKAIHND